MYPTPGFVVRGTFLEFEEDGEVEEPAPLARFHRSYSDSNIVTNQTPTSKFGSEELTIYCEMQKAHTSAGEEEMTVMKAIHERLSQMFFSTSLSNEDSPTDGSRTDASKPILEDADMTHDMETAEILRITTAVFEDADTSCDREATATLRPNAAECEEADTSFETEMSEILRLNTWGADQFEPSSPCTSLPKTPLDQCTTVSLSSLPSEYSRHMLVETLRREGFARTYDFVFLPMDLQTRSGNGSALVNFHSNSEARRAIAHFEGFSQWIVASSQVSKATWSKFLQGTNALIERHRNSPIMHVAVPEIYKPAMYDAAGKQVRFPEPTRRVRMPRLRRKAKQSNSLESACVPQVQAGGASFLPTHVNARHTAGKERTKKTNYAAPSSHASNDAWFVDVVASCYSGQAVPYQRRLSISQPPPGIWCV